MTQTPVWLEPLGRLVAKRPPWPKATLLEPDGAEDDRALEDELKVRIHII